MNHTARVYLQQNAVSGVDRWTAPAGVLRITSFAIDPTRTSLAPAVQPHRALFLGDSITEGWNTLGNGRADAYQSWVTAVGQALGAEFGQIGFSSQALSHGAGGGTNLSPLFTSGNDAASTWNKYSAGVSRLSAGLFSPPPDYIIVAMGRNDAVYGISNATFQAQMVAFLQALRAAAPQAKIAWLVPFSGLFRSNIVAGMATYQASPDSRARVIDLGSWAQAGLDNGASPNYFSVDAVHPSAFESIMLGAGVAAAITSAFAGVS